MKNLLSRWNPISLLFFGIAGIFMLMGLLNGFEYKALNLIVVIGSVVNALLIQYQKEHNID